MSEKRLSRRDFLRASALVAGGAVLAACQSAAPTTTQPAAPATQAPAAKSQGQATAAPAAPAKAALSGKIIFMCDTINEGHQKARDGWMQRFQAANTGVTVEHQPVPNTDYPTKLQTLFAAGTPPDVFRYLQENTPIVTAATKNMNLKLDSYVARDQYDLSGFRPDAVNLYRWEGALYALPRDYGNQNIYYNIDMFQKEGLKLPPTDWEDKTWTFQAFLEAAQKLTKKSGNRTEQYGFVLNRGLRPWSSWVYNNGGALVTKDDKGVAKAIALTEPAAVEALQFMQDLIYKHAVAPSPDVEKESGVAQLFSTGRVGMIMTNPSDVNLYRSVTAFKWDVAPLPLGKASRRGTGGGGTGWAIAAPSKLPDVAWEFLKSIASPQAELDEVAVGATTPARTAIATGKEFLDPNKPPANAKSFAQAQEYVVRDPVHARWPEVLQRVVNPTLDQLWSNAKNAADVAKAIKDAADPIFAQG